MSYQKDVLKDSSGNIIRPCTVSDNVVNPQTQHSVTEDLSGKIDKSSIVTSSSIPDDNTKVLGANVAHTMLQEIQALEGAQDVKKVFATASAMVGTGLSSGDQVKVLADENHDDKTTIYTYNGSTFDYVGSVGEYATKAEYDELADDVETIDGKVTELENVIPTLSKDTVITITKAQDNALYDHNGTLHTGVQSTVKAWVSEPIFVKRGTVLEVKNMYCVAPSDKFLGIVREVTSTGVHVNTLRRTDSRGNIASFDTTVVINHDCYIVLSLTDYNSNTSYRLFASGAINYSDYLANYRVLRLAKFGDFSALDNNGDFGYLASTYQLVERISANNMAYHKPSEGILYIYGINVYVWDAANNTMELVNGSKDVIKTTPQTLTNAQKAQARQNIGVESSDIEIAIPKAQDNALYDSDGVLHSGLNEFYKLWVSEPIFVKRGTILEVKTMTTASTSSKYMGIAREVTSTGEHIKTLMRSDHKSIQTDVPFSGTLVINRDCYIVLSLSDQNANTTYRVFTNSAINYSDYLANYRVVRLAKFGDFSALDNNGDFGYLASTYQLVERIGPNKYSYHSPSEGILYIYGTNVYVWDSTANDMALVNGSQTEGQYGCYICNRRTFHTTYAKLIEAYETLRSTYPKLVTRTQLGTNLDGTAIYEYCIGENTYNKYGSIRATADAPVDKLSIAILTGQHGWERSSVNGLLHFIEDMLGGNSHVADVLGNVYFRIIPCLNPKGFDLDIYGNGHFYTGHTYSVNLNGNYDYQWYQYSGDTTAFNGPSALSEKESQIATAWFNDIIDNDKASIVIDLHTGFSYEMFTFLRTSRTEMQSYSTPLRNMAWKSIKGIESVVRNYYAMQDIAEEHELVFCGAGSGELKCNFGGYADDYAISQGKHIPTIDIEGPEYLNGTDRQAAGALYATLIGNYFNLLADNMTPIDD